MERVDVISRKNFLKWGQGDSLGVKALALYGANPFDPNRYGCLSPTKPYL